MRLGSLCFLAFLWPSAAAADLTLPRLSVDAVDILWAYIGEGPNNATTIRKHMDDACSRGFTYLRFAASGFAAQDMTMYVKDEAQYWTLFDALVADAKKRNCLLLPSLLWNIKMFPQLTGTTLRSLVGMSGDGWAQASSYARKLVSRYANEPSIVAWELGNEFNLQADLSQNLPDDTYSSAALIQFMNSLADLIRANDQMHRLISTGHAIPRSAAEHLRHSFPEASNWTPDSPTEFSKNLCDMAASLDIISVHVYPGSGIARWNISDPYDPEIINYARTAVNECSTATKSKKLLYLGEFGDQQPPRTFSGRVLELLSREGPRVADMATLWVWEFFQFSPAVAANFSVSPITDAAFVADMEKVNTI